MSHEQVAQAHDGDVHSLRLIYPHVIGEHARHNGHADMVRERLGGLTGCRGDGCRGDRLWR